MLFAFETKNFLFLKKKVLYFQLITIRSPVVICVLGRYLSQDVTHFLLSALQYLNPG